MRDRGASVCVFASIQKPWSNYISHSLLNTKLHTRTLSRTRTMRNVAATTERLKRRVQKEEGGEHGGKIEGKKKEGESFSARAALLPCSFSA